MNIQKAMENGHRNSGFSHEKWVDFPWQNVAVHQRVWDIAWDFMVDLFFWHLLDVGQNGRPIKPTDVNV